jgi:hypothetical protein
MIQAGSTKHRREPEDQRNKRNIKRERRGKEKPKQDKRNKKETIKMYSIIFQGQA